MQQRWILAPLCISSWYSANFMDCFSCYIHKYYTTRKKAVLSQEDAAFKRWFLYLSQVFLLYLSPALCWSEAFVLICKRSRPVYNLFITFLYFILHEEIKEVNWIRTPLTTAFQKCATVSNAQRAFPSVCSPSFTYVPVTASNAASDLERSIRKWANQPIWLNAFLKSEKMCYKS